jgi:hypothetical protein
MVAGGNEGKGKIIPLILTLLSHQGGRETFIAEVSRHHILNHCLCSFRMKGVMS